MKIKNIINREKWQETYCNNDFRGNINIFDIYDGNEKYAEVYYLKKRFGFFYKDKNHKRAQRISFHEYYQEDKDLRYNELIYRLIISCQKKVEIIEGDFSYYFEPLYKAAAEELSNEIESTYKASEITSDVVDSHLKRKMNKEVGRFFYQDWLEIGNIIKRNNWCMV